MYKNKRVLVTGGTGMIGYALVNKLISLEAEIFVASLETYEQALNMFPTLDKQHFFRADLTEKQNCKTVTKDMDYVFHVAGIKGSVSLGQSKAASWFTPLIQMNTNMMEAAFKSGVERYLYTSSIGVYPEAEVFEEENAWNGEPFSADVYPGWAKRIGELQASAYKLEHNWGKIAIVRPANVYGPHDNFNPNTAMVVGSLISKFWNYDGNGKVHVWGDGTAKRDFIFSEDVADGMLKALEFGANCTPINLGSGKAVSIKELAQTIASEFGWGDENLIFDKSKPSGETIRLMSTKRAKNMIGFEANTPLAEGISKTINWFSDGKALEERFDPLK